MEGQALLVFIVDEMNSKLQSKKKNSYLKKFAMEYVIEFFGSGTRNTLVRTAKEVKGD